VLVFLPSWQAIVDVYEDIAKDVHVFERCDIHVLHSSLPMNEQTAVFEPAPPGVVRL
jgi:HrpA-like RNA helicase